MAFSTVAQDAADKITQAAMGKGISINQLQKNAGVSKSVVDRMKDGIMPSADKLAALASALDLPMEYLIGSGVFSKWDLVLEHRTAVLSGISGVMKDLSTNLRYDVDDLTLARLVSAFNVDIDVADDPAGIEIIVTAPFATHEISSSSIKSEITASEAHLLKLFREINQEGQEKILDNADDLVASGKYKKYGSDGVATKEA